MKAPWHSRREQNISTGRRRAVKRICVAWSIYARKQEENACRHCVGNSISSSSSSTSSSSTMASSASSSVKAAASSMIRTGRYTSLVRETKAALEMMQVKQEVNYN